MPQISISRFALLIGIVLAVFFGGLGSARLWDRDEPRNARASHEMLERGDWIVPTFNGQLRDHKPILLYWGQMVSYLAAGESEFTARLPSALSAVLAIWAIALLGSRLSGRKRGISRDGFWAAAALATCLLFVMAGRAATPDACLIAFSTLGIAALVIASLAPSPPYSSGQVGPARLLPAALGYTMLGLAALAKGPVGIVLPLAVVHIWWLVCYRWQQASPSSLAEKSTPAWLRHLAYETWQTFHPFQCLRAVWALRTVPGILLCLLAAAPWYVAVGIETDGAFLRGFFFEHNVGRAIHSMEGHSGSILFYPAAFLLGTFPWSLWLIPILLWCRQASRECVVQRQMVVLAATWVVVYLAAFSIASTKLPSYITPCYAGAALAIGGYLRQFESTWALPSVKWRWAAYGLTILVGSGIAGGILWLSVDQQMPILMRVAAGGGVISAIGAVAILWERVQRVAWIPLTWLVGAAGFHFILFGVGAKSVDSYRNDLRMLSEVSQVAPSRHWLSVGGLEPSWVHYLDCQIVEVTSNIAEPQSWEEIRAFFRRHPQGRMIVVGKEANERLTHWALEHQFQWTLEQLAATDRFLRPGGLAVYSIDSSEGLPFENPLLGPSDTVDGPTVQLPPRIRVQTVGHQRPASGSQDSSAAGSSAKGISPVGSSAPETPPDDSPSGSHENRMRHPRTELEALPTEEPSPTAYPNPLRWQGNPAMDSPQQ